MTIHCPMSQGSVHNWKCPSSSMACITHQTCHPLNMFGMVWVDVYDSLSKCNYSDSFN
jgi:hypothetical protein